MLRIAIDHQPQNGESRVNQFLGEIRILGRDTTPDGWALCDGQLLAVSEYPLLYQLIGTTFGGDGDTTFALPDLRGRSPMHQGAGSNLTPRTMGQMFGTETVKLSMQELPSHSHRARALNAVGARAEPTDAVWAVASTGERQYASKPADTSMVAGCITPAGRSLDHSNMMPCVCVSFMIALEGLFPTPA
jgi:microcystin-dependent protein